MARFIFEQLEKKRVYYNGLTEEQFKNEIVISDKVVQDFISFAKFRRINLRADVYKEDYKRYLKATMAQQLFGDNAFERMVNENDAMLKKIIEISQN
jgi:carboxyl-terminal processing protease